MTQRVRRSCSYGRALLALAALGCSRPQPTDAAQMQTDIAPYLEEFASYDRWARRLGLADSAFRSNEALEEAAFAPLRRGSRAAFAWLDREGPDPHHFAHPPDAPAPPTQGWVRVHTESLGDVDALHASLPIEGNARRCLLVRRSAPAPGNATLHVTLAFPE